MSRTHPFDPLRPGISMGRITSGAVAGAIGGMAFGVLMLADFTVNQQTGRTGMAQLVEQFLGTTNVMTVWAVHMATSVALGIIFSFFILPQSFRSSIVWALGYIAIAGFLLSQVILRRLIDGYDIVFDAGAAFALVGHLVYGLFMGLTYVWFHDLEMREALDAQSEKWRAWGRHERDDLDG